MRLPIRIVLAALVIAALAAAIWHGTRPEPVEVKLHTVDRGRVEATVANTRVGTVKACRRAYLAPMVAGQVAVLNAHEGDRVQKDATLLEIWNADLKAQVANAQAEAHANRARIREACANAEGAEREAARLRKLVGRNLVSVDAADTAQTRASAQRATCDWARAQQSVADARVQVARESLERTIVRAPFPGTVAEVNAELGGYVTPSPQGIQTLPAIDLLDLSCLYVSAPIDEVDAPALKAGMRACVSLDAFANKRCNGVVRRIAPYVIDTEKQARTVEVEVELRDPKDLADLLPGYSADIEVVLDARDGVVRIPTEAVLEGDRVYVYEPGAGRIARRDIRTGLSNWRFTEVRSGLQPGDRIVLSIGAEGVADGARVVPAADADAAKK
ncbi:MAG: efflux RND transporter periplasmic adaptor subunit [Gammaproteobacteria bacterium]